MEKQNPCTLPFGKVPTQLIARTAQSQQVIDAFPGEPSAQQVYMATGIRGSGKTVSMTETTREIASQKDWISVEPIHLAEVFPAASLVEPHQVGDQAQAVG